MLEINLLREALWKTSHEFGMNGDHDSALISQALEQLVVNFEHLLAKFKEEEE